MSFVLFLAVIFQLEKLTNLKYNSFNLHRERILMIKLF